MVSSKSPRDTLEDRHDGRDPAPLPMTSAAATRRYALSQDSSCSDEGVTVGKRRHRMDRREEGVLIQHPQLGPVTLDPLRWGLVHHDLLTTTSVTATEK
jgi:hypothetical protein